MAKLGEANIGGRMVPAWLLDLTAEELDGLKWHTNKNLLDNWYFVGGGSQQGGGQFPINQRGQTSYTVFNGGCIDRWKLFASPTLTLEDGFASLTSGNIASQFRQILSAEVTEQIKGQTATISVLTDQGLFSATFTISQDGSFISGSRISFGSWYADVYSSAQIEIEFRFVSLDTSSTLNIRAAKLELGPTQTLAYQDEEGNWQLFETPDYGEELAKCQRYQLVLSSTDTYSSVGSGVVHTTTGAHIVISLPNTLRIKPTLSYSGNFQLLTKGGGPTVTGIVLESINQNCVSVQATSSGLVVGQAAILRSNNDVNAKIILDANL